MRGLSGKIALVTGATGLIGSAISQRLAEEGTTVIVTSRCLEKAKNWIKQQSKHINNKMIPMGLNLSNESNICSVLGKLKNQKIIPHILIANASNRDKVGGKITDLSYQNFNNLFEVDVTGHFLLARNLVEEQDNNITSSIIFLSSIYACAGVDHSIYPYGMSPTPIHYATVKSGILGMTKYLASLWGIKNIRVNAIIAGGVRNTERQTDEFVNNYSSKTMLRRMAKPEEIASSVTFLASDDSSYITGASIIVDGGLLAW